MIAFNFPAHARVCAAAKEVITAHGIGEDVYAIERAGEISLLNRETLIMLLNNLAKGVPNEQLEMGGGDVGRTGGDAA